MQPPWFQQIWVKKHQRQGGLSLWRKNKTFWKRERGNDDEDILVYVDIDHGGHWPLSTQGGQGKGLKEETRSNPICNLFSIDDKKTLHIPLGLLPSAPPCNIAKRYSSDPKFKISIFEICLHLINYNSTPYFLTSSTRSRNAGTSKETPPDEKWKIITRDTNHFLILILSIQSLR